MMRSDRYARRALDYSRLAAQVDTRDQAMFLAVAQGMRALARRSAHLEAISRRCPPAGSPGPSTASGGSDSDAEAYHTRLGRACENQLGCR